jgi:hypothetical protein
VEKERQPSRGVGIHRAWINTVNDTSPADGSAAEEDNKTNLRWASWCSRHVHVTFILIRFGSPPSYFFPIRNGGGLVWPCDYKLADFFSSPFNQQPSGRPAAIPQKDTSQTDTQTQTRKRKTLSLFSTLETNSVWFTSIQQHKWWLYFFVFVGFCLLFLFVSVSVFVFSRSFYFSHLLPYRITY